LIEIEKNAQPRDADFEIQVSNLLIINAFCCHEPYLLKPVAMLVEVVDKLDPTVWVSPIVQYLDCAMPR
jgi:hypothetical protein